MKCWIGKKRGEEEEKEEVNLFSDPADTAAASSPPQLIKKGLRQQSQIAGPGMKRIFRSCAARVCSSSSSSGTSYNSVTFFSRCLP